SVRPASKRDWSAANRSVTGPCAPPPPGCAWPPAPPCPHAAKPPAALPTSAARNTARRVPPNPHIRVPAILCSLSACICVHLRFRFSSSPAPTWDALEPAQRLGDRRLHRQALHRRGADEPHRVTALLDVARVVRRSDWAPV